MTERAESIKSRVEAIKLACAESNVIRQELEQIIASS